MEREHFGTEGLLIPPPRPPRKTNWDRLALVISIFAAFISLGAAIFSGLQWWEAKKATDVAVDALVEEHRPLIEILDARFTNSSSLQLSMKNSGRSTAVNISHRVWCEFGNRVFGSAPKWPRFEKQFEMPMGVLKQPAVAAGSPFVTFGYLPGVPLIEARGYQYTKNMSIRLRGDFSYSDLRHHEFHLIWCYETVRPYDANLPGVFVCPEADAFGN